MSTYKVPKGLEEIEIMPVDAREYNSREEILVPVWLVSLLTGRSMESIHNAIHREVIPRNGVEFSGAGGYYLNTESQTEIKIWALEEWLSKVRPYIRRTISINKKQKLD